MYDQAKGGSKEKRRNQELEVSIYDAINTLIAHGHDKDAIIRTYSREEIALFYEKCLKYDMRNKADDIESVLAGIGGAFGGGKKIEKLLAKMRE